MIRKLYLMRHGTACAPRFSEDFERPLATNGIEQAYQAGKWFDTHACLQMILVSSALRTRQTATEIVHVLGDKGPTPKLENSLYNADESTILETIFGVPDTADEVLVIAHNPGIWQSAINLSGHNSAVSVIQNLYSGFEPASIAVIETASTWSEIQQESSLQNFVSGSIFL